MGFSIKTTFNDDFKWAAVFHAAIGLLLPLLLLSLVGCQENLLLEDAELGPESTEDQVYDTLEESIGDHSPELLETGAYTFFERNVRVETSAVAKVEEVYTEIINRDTELSTEFDRLMIQENYLNYQEENPQVVAKQITWDVNKMPSLNSMSRVNKNWVSAAFAVTSPLSHFGELSKSVVQALSEPVRSSFHGLTKKTYTDNWSSGCLNAPTCNLTINEVKVSLVSWYADKSFDKTDIAFRFSRDIPRLHRLIPPDSDPLGQIIGAAVSFCQAGKVRETGKSYFVNACWVLREFKF